MNEMDSLQFAGLCQSLRETGHLRERAGSSSSRRRVQDSKTTKSFIYAEGQFFEVFS